MSGRFDLRRHLPSVTFVLIALFVLAGFAGIFIYIGAYNIAADAPHSRIVYGMLDELRERSIASRARGIKPPSDLGDPKRIAAGAALYDEMCTGCHLGPGLEKSEISQGLYPPAPGLARGSELTPAQQFWVTKHGVKLTAMPAWGKTHDDRLIWDMVAFLRGLPKMSPEQYRTAVARAPGSHAEMMEGHRREAPAKAAPHSHSGKHPHEHHD